MRKETSVLEIFQDPLLILVALILLGTLWIIIPAERSEPAGGLSVSQIIKETEKLREDIDSLNAKMKELEAELQRLRDEIHVIEISEKDTKEEEAIANQKVNQLEQEMNNLRKIIQNKKAELKRLEKELEEARKQAEDAKLAEELDRKLKELKEEIDNKEGFLKTLEEKMRMARESQKTREEEQRRHLGEMQHQVDAEKKKIKELEKEKGELERFVPGGIGTYSPDLVENKEQVTFEAVNNRLVLINEKNYDIEAFRTMHNGKIVTAAKLTRKGSAVSEPINKIIESGSEFQKELGKLDPQKHYIFFGVQRDSFEVFLEARQIAWKKGFVVAWHPLNEGPIYAGEGGEEVEGRSR